MSRKYSEIIQQLVDAAPFSIDTEVKFDNKPPTTASSEFLTNKEQGDWAERVVLQAINGNSKSHIAVNYGRSDSLSAGDPEFADFYMQYQNELNQIGKKPDILIFRKDQFPNITSDDLVNDDIVRNAVAAIEVRSSSFLSQKYAEFMDDRTRNAEQECMRLKSILVSDPFSQLLSEKRPELYSLLVHATNETFRELDFRYQAWSSSEKLRELSRLLKELKSQIKTLHKRDYLSITPKIEDLALVNRWIQHYGVKHYYLQVFFDKAFIIPFQQILEISSDSSQDGVVFSVERDKKNQGKSTIKINVQVGREIIGRIDMPDHRSALKELDRGRLLFYVTFEGGKGYLDVDVFDKEVVNG